MPQVEVGKRMAIKTRETSKTLQNIKTGHCSDPMNALHKTAWFV